MSTAAPPTTRPRRAYVVTFRDSPEGGVYLARTAGAARYLALLDLRDTSPDLTFADLRSRRAPEYDEAGFSGVRADVVDAILQERDRVEQWNAAYPVGTPVVVRLDSGVERDTYTRFPASVVGGRAVVWCCDIASCYALSHVSPVPAAVQP